MGQQQKTPNKGVFLVVTMTSLATIHAKMKYWFGGFMQTDLTDKSRVLSEKWLLIGTMLSSSGNSMIWPVMTLYMTGTLHQSFTTAGIVLMIGALMGMIGAFIGGKLFDRWHPYKAMVMTSLVTLVSVTSLIFWNSWPVFAILVWLANLSMGVEQTLVNAFATIIPGHKARVVFNNLYIVLNIGVVVGTLAVGYLFDLGFSLLMSISASIYAVLAVIVITKFNVNLSARKKVVTDVTEMATTTAKFKVTFLLAVIGALLFITYLSYMLWETVMAPHMKMIGMPTRNYADLWMINGVTIIIFQKFVSNWANKHPYHVSVIIGSIIFASSFFFLIFVQEFWQMVIVFELLTVGEMLQSPQVPAWVAQITPPAVAGQAQGFVTMMISFGRVVGPIYSGLMMDKGWMNSLFLSVFIAMMLVTGFLLFMVRRPVDKHSAT